MSPQFVSEMKGIVLRMQQETIQALGNIPKSAIENSQAPDEIDRASNQIEIENAILYRDQLTAKLREIERTLKKFDTGDYGLCEASDEEIPLNRLRANPLARYTVEEQERRETRSRQKFPAMA